MGENGTICAGAEVWEPLGGGRWGGVTQRAEALRGRPATESQPQQPRAQPAWQQSGPPSPPPPPRRRGRGCWAACRCGAMARLCPRTAWSSAPPAKAESRPGVWPDGPTRMDAALIPARPAVAMDGVGSGQGGFCVAPQGIERSSHPQPAWVRKPGSHHYPLEGLDARLTQSWSSRGPGRFLLA